MIVVDASALVALLSAGVDGEWVADRVRGHELVAPHLVCFEAANILRRLESAGFLDRSQAAQAHADLLALPLDLAAYDAVAARAWALRANVTVYDAAYVALAEVLEAPLITLDRRLARAPGIRCAVETPP